MEARLESGLSSMCSGLNHCLLSSTVGIVVQCCELRTCHHAFMGKVLTLGAVLQIFRVVHLQLSSVAEFRELFDVFQDPFVQHHLLKGNVFRGVRLQPLLFPDLSTGQCWMAAFVKVGVAISLVFICDVHHY